VRFAWTIPVLREATAPPGELGVPLGNQRVPQAEEWRCTCRFCEMSSPATPIKRLCKTENDCVGHLLPQHDYHHA